MYDVCLLKIGEGGARVEERKQGERKPRREEKLEKRK